MYHGDFGNTHHVTIDGSTGQLVSSDRVFINGVPVKDVGYHEPEVYLVVGKQRPGGDGSPIDLSPPDPNRLPVEKDDDSEEDEDPEDPKKRRNFMSRDLLEAWKKFAEEAEDKAEVEEKVRKWEPEVAKMEAEMAGSETTTTEGGGSSEGEEGESTTEGGEGEEASSEGGE